MPEKIVGAGELKLWTEDFGDPADPAVLLIIGGVAQSIQWPDSLCRGLAASGRHVIRYDHRNTGKSSLVDFEKDPYDCHDLARDALAVLDAYGVDSAHVVGLSMGGYIGMLMALDHRPRMRSLTLISTSSAMAANPSALDGEPLFFSPPPDARYLEQLAAVKAELAAHPPTTREEFIEAKYRIYALVAGTTEYDLEECRRTMAREFDRANDPVHPDATASAIAATAAEGDLAPRLRSLDIPTLVIHGADDPIVPLEHGRALVENIPGAQGLFIEGYGHALMNAAVIEQWRAALTAFTGGA
ncbi:alpha/beta hydrolase [Streptomyces actinomycinicus]|uniref:Alpha/beta hydrolase n=1 Tax=Streptomyces actinomycinicus TaxID=1695166 RepID=A0A937EJW2_9ACTN|nr:alpha/beta fold hydrolase [Streptomyces actinomycinicus]MBL1083476.1 alpha/beta hydrolase [Streptomyces actinomycinicus]